MSDYIEREDALDIVAHNNVNGEITLNRYDKIIDGIYEIPSADVAPTIEVPQWIPCEERLPDERQDVYVTVLWDDYGDYVTAYGMRTKFGWNLHSNTEGELIKGYTVVAWMPLPEPYEGERKDDE